MTIQKLVHYQLERIGIFKKNNNYDYTLTIIGQTNDKNPSTKASNNPLIKIRITNIPQENLWIFENENSFKQFTSSGSKVEKTLIYKYNKKIFIVLIELKSTITPKEFKAIKVKFEDSLDTISPYLAAHPEIFTCDESDIITIGLCCYNEYSDSKPLSDRDPKYLPQKIRECIDKRSNLLNEDIEPIVFNKTNIRIILNKNPESNSSCFDVDFQEFFKKAIQITSTSLKLNE